MIKRGVAAKVICAVVMAFFMFSFFSLPVSVKAETNGIINDIDVPSVHTAVDSSSPVEEEGQDNLDDNSNGISDVTNPADSMDSDIESDNYLVIKSEPTDSIEPTPAQEVQEPTISDVVYNEDTIETPIVEPDPPEMETEAQVYNPADIQFLVDSVPINKAPISAGNHLIFDFVVDVQDTSDVRVVFPCPVIWDDLMAPGIVDADGNLRTDSTPSIRLHAVPVDESGTEYRIVPIYYDLDSAYRHSEIDSVVPWPRGLSFGVGSTRIQSVGGEWAKSFTLNIKSLNKSELKEPDIYFSALAEDMVASHDGAVGPVGNNIVRPIFREETGSTPLVFYFKNPVKLINPSLVTFERITPVETFSGTFADLGMDFLNGRYSHVHNIGRFTIPAFWGDCYSGSRVTITFEPGSLESEDGLLNTVPLEVTGSIKGNVVSDLSPQPPVASPVKLPNEVKIDWQIDLDGSYLWGPVKDGSGHIYVGGDGLYCFDEQGNEVWRKNGLYSAPIVGGDGVLRIVREESYANPLPVKFHYFEGYNPDSSLRFSTLLPGIVPALDLEFPFLSDEQGHSLIVVCHDRLDWTGAYADGFLAVLSHTGQVEKLVKFFHKDMASSLVCTPDYLRWDGDKAVITNVYGAAWTAGVNLDTLELVPESSLESDLALKDLPFNERPIPPQFIQSDQAGSKLSMPPVIFNECTIAYGNGEVFYKAKDKGLLITTDGTYRSDNGKYKTNLGEIWVYSELSSEDKNLFYTEEGISRANINGNKWVVYPVPVVDGEWTYTPSFADLLERANRLKNMRLIRAIAGSIITLEVKDGTSKYVLTRFTPTVPPVEPPPVVVARSLEIIPGTATIKVGEEQQFTAKLTFSDTTVKDVTDTAVWVTSDAGIATINKGLATGLKAGLVTVTAQDSGLTATAALKINKPPSIPDPPPGGGGDVTPPEPDPEPEPEPIIEPDPEPEPIVEPEPQPEPEPIDESEPKPILRPEPAPKTEPEPVPEIVTGIIRGTVKLKDGKPLPNTRIELHSDVRSTFTDENGYFEFRNVPLGDHALYVADLKVANEKILLKTLRVEAAGTVNEIPATKLNGRACAAEVTLTESVPVQTVAMVLDYDIPQEAEPNKFPLWPFLFLFLIPILLRRRKKKEDEDADNSVA